MVMMALLLVAQNNEKKKRIKRDNLNGRERAEHAHSSTTGQKKCFLGALKWKVATQAGYGVTLKIPYDNWPYAEWFAP